MSEKNLLVEQVVVVGRGGAVSRAHGLFPIPGGNEQDVKAMLKLYDEENIVM